MDPSQPANDNAQPQQQSVNPSLPPDPQTVTPQDPTAGQPADMPPPPPAEQYLAPAQAQPIVSTPTIPVPPTGQTMYMSPPQPKGRKHVVLAVSFIVVLLLIAGGLALALRSPSPDSLLSAALANSLKTKSYTESVGAAAAGDPDVKVAADVSDPKSPKALFTVNLSDDQIGTMTAMVYSDTGAAYVKYTHVSKISSSDSDKLLNKWAQFKKSGTTASDADTMGIAAYGEPRYNVLGQLITGDFSKSQQKELTSFMQSHHVYTLKEGTNKTVKLNGHKTTQLDVSINTMQLKALNVKVASMIGLNSSDVDKLGVDSVKSATLYIDNHSKTVTKVVAKTSDGSNTVTYSNYDASSAGATPSAQIDLKALDDGLVAALLSSLSPSEAGLQDQAKDSERQVDIQALDTQLEAFNAQDGFYPTLAQLNDAGWRATNMSGLDAAALQDPNGSSPTLAAAPAAGVYAYQPTACVSDECTGSFTLTATLSDGTPYVKQSL